MAARARETRRASENIELEADFERSQFMLAVAAAFPFVFALLLQLISNKTAFHWVATLLLVLTGGACIGQRVHQAELGRSSHALHLALGAWITTVALVVLAYVGPFSAGAIVLSPICYVFGFSRPRIKGQVVLGAAMFGFFLITVLALVGGIDPTAGPIGVSARRPWLAVAGLGAVTELVMVASFLVSRRSRELLDRCIERIEEAHAELGRRDDELEHARWDLDHVIELAQVGHLTGTRMGRYRIGELIGRGGMGEVYRAWGADAAQPIALKVLTPAMSNNPAMVERFFREARVSSSLASPHIVDVLDSGWADGGYPFLAMELLRGRDLAVHLADKEIMEPLGVIDLVEQVASALRVAHDVGIVHRDIKPENIFCAHGAQGPHWVVLDFGVSKVKGGTGTLTQGGLVGTPRYMAPEQARGLDVDARADVFSLGAIAYRCLTGRAAFDAQDTLGALLQVMSEKPLSPRAGADVEEDLELVLALALARDPARRIASVQMFSRALADASRGELDERLRRDARMLLVVEPWKRDDVEPDTLVPGTWMRDSNEHRIHTTPLPYMDTCCDMASYPPPPFRESEDSITALAAS